MPHTGGRCHDHTCTGEPRTPAQVDVVGTGERRRVESAELVEQVGPYEHGGVRNEEDVAHAVVLFLIDLVGFDARERDAVMVDRHADLEEDLGVLLVDDLGADDAGVRAVRLLDHQPDRVGVEHHVVVHDAARTSRPRPTSSASLAAAANPRSAPGSAGRRRTNARGIAAAMRASGPRPIRCRGRGPKGPDSPVRRAPRGCPRATDQGRW